MHLHLLSILTPALHLWELSSWLYFKGNRKKECTPRVRKRCEEPACPRRLIWGMESKELCLDLPGPGYTHLYFRIGVCHKHRGILIVSEADRLSRGTARHTPFCHHLAFTGSHQATFTEGPFPACPWTLLWNWVGALQFWFVPYLTLFSHLLSLGCLTEPVDQTWKKMQEENYYYYVFHGLSGN